MPLFSLNTSDEDAAIASRKSFATPDSAQTRARQQIDTIVLSDDPFVDIHRLFALYNVLYFRSMLIPRVSISWDPHLTHCPGACELTRNEEGRYDQVLVRISEPVHRFRARADVINTVLHESLHAYFFIATRWHHVRNETKEGHGTGFALLATTINSHGGYNISPLHGFKDSESGAVDSYGSHIWQCTGSCADKGPFYGLIKRGTDQPPSKTDAWYRRHKDECGGRWKKLAVPEMTKAQVEARFLKLGLRRRASVDVDGAPDGKARREGDEWTINSPTTLFSGYGGERTDSVSSVVSDFGAMFTRRSSTTSMRRSSMQSYVRKGSLQMFLRKNSLMETTGVDMSTACCPVCHVKVFTQVLQDHVDRQHSEYAK